MTLTLLGKLVLALSVPITVALFATQTPRRAMMISLLMGFLFLPVISIRIVGIPDLTKQSVSTLTIMMCVVLFDARSLFNFKIHPLDIAALVWCLCPFVSAITNGAGPYDGMSESLRYMFIWGIPYYLGRIYIKRPEHLRELAMLMFIAGLIYMPLCWYELRMSPQLHNRLFGFHPTEFVHLKRSGGYRPMVFLEGGLAMGMWLTATSLVSVWMWRTKAMVKVGGIPVLYLLPLLLLTTLLTKAVFATLLLFFGLAMLYGISMTRISAPLFAAALIVVLYVGCRTTGLWSGDFLINTSTAVISESRGSSIATRIHNEDAIIRHVMSNDKILFGFGAGKAWRPTDWAEQDRVLADGLWIITLGRAGLLGIIALTTVMLAPALLWVIKFPPRLWRHPLFAPGAALAVLMVLHMMDSLLNDMPNPIYFMANGGLASLAAVGLPKSMKKRKPHKRPATHQATQTASEDEQPESAQIADATVTGST